VVDGERVGVCGEEGAEVVSASLDGRVEQAAALLPRAEPFSQVIHVVPHAVSVGTCCDKCEG
jgi:hypothetical protein